MNTNIIIKNIDNNNNYYKNNKNNNNNNNEKIPKYEHKRICSLQLNYKSLFWLQTVGIIKVPPRKYDPNDIITINDDDQCNFIPYQKKEEISPENSEENSIVTNKLSKSRSFHKNNLKFSWNFFYEFY